MKVLFDHNMPKRLRHLLPGHAVITSRELGWDTLKNGDLLDAGAADGFEVMVTGDNNLSYQQNLSGRKIALVVLSTTNWNVLKRNPAPVAAALDGAKLGGFQAVNVDLPPSS